MLTVTAAQLTTASPRGNPTVIDAIASKSEVMFAKYGITNRARALGFLSVAYEETGGFVNLTENLNYSSMRLVEVWPSRFPTVASAEPYARNPTALANRVYGGRLGNVGPDDGWLYRGHGLIQITGRDNFALVEKLTGLPALKSPDIVCSPEHMLECALALFVNFPGIREYCDQGKWQQVWALVGTGRATGKIINLENHQTALARLSVATGSMGATPTPVAPPVPPPAPPDTPAPAVVPLSLWARLRAWLARI